MIKLSCLRTLGRTSVKILFLGYTKNGIIDFLRTEGHRVVTTEQEFSFKEIEETDPAWIITYGYRHIIKKPTIAEYRNRIINLHISYLPWNRGVSPNLWSFLEDSKKGVTIHYLDEGIDTGDILAQKEVEFDADETLKSSYMKLRETMEFLFIECWPDISIGRTVPVEQDLEGGSYHSIADTDKVVEQLGLKDWGIKVAELQVIKAAGVLKK